MVLNLSRYRLGARSTRRQRARGHGFEVEEDYALELVPIGRTSCNTDAHVGCDTFRLAGVRHVHIYIWQYTLLH